MLTVEQYEAYKNKLQQASTELVRLEAKETQLREQLLTTYNLTPEQAQEEITKLEETIPQMEAQFTKDYQEFMEKWNTYLKS